ncbi:SGNH/GDSL hydrolase family protein [Xanthomonas campestris]|uniref:SGNH/GDSL hydrolase family protein n=1 Tax=Xanthomonas campestris TaxID=339 RepID=UPI001C842C4D|nr:SGNH/GDSL hydrolase family protein [Xanthomonas campestris]
MAVAIALAASPAMADSAFDQTVFFGDSLTDSGYYNPLLPAASRAVTGKFTTNPGWVWAEYVGDHFGTNAAPNGNGQTGDNYAAGGARIQASSVSALGAAPSVTSQVNTYLVANGGQANPNALYTVWGGANDLLAAATAPAQAQAIIGSAVTAQVGAVGALQAAGARYVMVPTIPDVGITPRFRAGGAAAMAQGTAAATAYNTALFNGLQSAGLRVIPVDTFHILQEVVADPGIYGFSNVTGTACNPALALPACNPTSLVAANAPNTYVFADGIHPTTATHQILGQYAISLLEAPRLQQVLTRSAQAGGRARADQVAWHLDGKPEADGLRWWGSVRGDIQRYDDADLYDGMAPAGLFGVDWTAGDLVFGGFAGFGRMDADFGNRNGSFKQDDTTLGYADQDIDSLVGRIGFQVRLDGAPVKPYLQATYDHEFKDGTEASAWLQSMPEVGMYTVPGQNFDRNYATVVLGARTGIWGLQSNIGLSTTTAQRSARDATVFVNFSGNF